MVRRRMAILAGLAVLGAMLVANAGSAVAAKKPAIAVFYYNTSPFGIAGKNASIAAAKKLGATVTTFNANNDPKAQLNQVQDAITTGKYQGFWLWSLDPTSLAPQVARATAKGIKVAQADYTFGGLQDQINLAAKPNLLTTVGQGELGQEQALVTMVKEGCATQVGAGKPCNAAIMVGLDNYPTDVLRINYLKKAFKSGPIKVTFTPQGGYDQPTAQQVALQYFGAHKDVDVFGTLADQMTAGALTAFGQLGIKPGKDLQVFSVGGTSEMITKVKAGTVFGVGTLWPSAESTVAIKLLVDAINGKKVPKLVNIITKSRPRIIDKAFLKANPHFLSDWSLGG